MASRFAITKASKTLTRDRLSAISRCFEPLRFHSSAFRRPDRGDLAGVSRPSVSRSMASAASETSFSALDTRVPATVITGFLGSGKVRTWGSQIGQDEIILLLLTANPKDLASLVGSNCQVQLLKSTTLLNHILTSQHGKRIAVIENEFGEVDIDGSLVASHSSVAEEIVMVNNGCLCCTVRGDLVKMLLELVKKKRDKFDHIVIETTGLAKPSPVIETFNSDELVAQHIKLDGVVTLVDSKHAAQHLDEVKPRWVVNEAVEQIAYADRIVLNKIDLVSEAELEALTKRVKHLNGIAQIKHAKFGDVDLDFVLGVGGYDLDRIDHIHGEGGHDHHGEHHHGHTHDSSVRSISIVSEGILDVDEVNDWLERLVEEKGEDLYRMKGVLSVNESTGRYVVQGVHSMLEGCPAKPWGDAEKRISKLVFIGRNLDETALRKAFKGCLM